MGRFSPSFGSFNLRHDPANHRLSDKPLPYDMGRMLRLRGWNLGVLPSPFPDNGLELGGKLSFSSGSSLDYAAYAVSGFKGDARAADIDFAQSRDGNVYYVDNNGRPTFGRLTSLALIAGAPAILGAWIGGYVTSDILGVLFFALAAGAAFQVVVEVGRFVARRAPGGLTSGYAVGGFLTGIAVMYATGLLAG